MSRRTHSEQDSYGGQGLFTLLGIRLRGGTSSVVPPIRTGGLRGHTQSSRDERANESGL